MDDTPTCPPWWPQLLWGLHFHPRPWPGPGPINYPPIIEDIMASLHVHALSYLMIDQGAANQIRTVAERRLMHAAENLSTYHKESAEKVSSILPAVRSAPNVQSARGMDPVADSKIRAVAEEGLLHAAQGLSKYGRT
jgi:hypothetical protein